MADMRQTPNGTETQEDRDIDLDGRALIGMNSYLYEQAEGLTDVTISIETEYNYGDPEIVRTYLSGWRLATDEEIRQHAAQTHQTQRFVRLQQERQFAQLKSQRPDLFE